MLSRLYKHIRFKHCYIGTQTEKKNTNEKKYVGTLIFVTDLTFAFPLLYFRMFLLNRLILNQNLKNYNTLRLYRAHECVILLP